MADTQRSKLGNPNARPRTRVHSMQLRSHSINNKHREDRETDKNLIGKQINPSLPIEIIRKILLFLPADFLYNVMRLVCQEWREIINEAGFIREHFSLLATYTLIESYEVSNQEMYHFIEMGNGQEKWERKGKRSGIKPRQGESILTKEELGDDVIINSCDGLILTKHTNPEGRSGFSLFNPARKERMIVNLDPSNKTPYYIAAIARGRAGSEYKLVVTCRNFPRTSPDSFTVSIMTIGSDDNSWREVEDGRKIVPECRVNSVGRYVYWVYCKRHLMFARVLDTVTETMHEVKNGPGRWYLDCFNYYIKSENFLILANIRDGVTWEFWGLTDPKSEEWTKLYNFNLSSKLDLIGVREKWQRFAKPELVVLKSDTVFFSFGRFPYFVGYNVRSGHIYKMARHREGYLVSSHVRSLVPILKQPR